MKDLFDIVNESEMLCEAFNDPRIYQAWKTLQRYKIKWKDIFYWGNGRDIAWDKIPPSEVEEIDSSNIEKLFKSIRRDKRGYEERPFVLLGFKKEKLQYVYDSYTHRFGMLSYSAYSVYSGNGGSVDWYEGGGNSRNYMAERDQFSYMNKCDYILKIYSDNVNTRQLKNDRSAAIAGSWQMSDYDHKTRHTVRGVLGKEKGGLEQHSVYSAYSGGQFYQMCNKMAKDAVAKWKKIVAENKFARDQDTSKVDNAVQGIMNRITKATANVMKDPEKYDQKNTGISLDKLLKSIYDQDRYVSGTSSRNPGYWAGRNGLLANYQKFCEACVVLKKGSTSVYQGADYYIQERDKYRDAVLKQAEQLDEMLKKFDA